ncbi:MAG: hypothetical protein HY298_03040 [Verrucomicrobia bacterium]|nr:hypothetical protein [Verrucomicrobiota bacterium]
MRRYILVLAICLCAPLMIVGCGKDTTASTAAELQKAFQSRTPPPANREIATPDQSIQVQQAVNAAVSAMKSNDYAGAFFKLRALQSAPRITVDQYSAVEKARLTVEREMAAKAASGNPAAQKALDAIRKTGR